MAWYSIVCIVLGGVAGGLLLLTVWGVCENHALQRTEYCVRSKRLPAAFAGVRIAHVSDLHNARFGKGQTRLIAALRAAAPTYIAITGDLIDKRRPGRNNALDFCRAACAVAPVYYVPGNHEAKSGEYPALQRELQKIGVQILSGARVTLTRQDAQIVMAGIADARFVSDDSKQFAAVAARALAPLASDKAHFTILLAHRPELFAVYRAAGMDLVLCGHAHGGQFRLPFVGGLIAPEQGLFPKYDGGLYAEEGSVMVVSRGLGNSSIPIRLNNRPQLVVVTLQQ